MSGRALAAGVAVCALLLGCGADDQEAEPGVTSEPETPPSSGEPISPTDDRMAELELVGADFEVLVFYGTIDLVAGEAELSSASRMPSIRPFEEPTPGPFQLVLYGDDGEVVRRIAFTPAEPSPEDGEVVAYFTVEAELPVPPLSRVTVVHDGVEIGSREAGPSVPNVRIVAPEPGDGIDPPGLVEWESDDADGDELSHSVLTTTGGGGEWRAVGAALTSSSIRLSDLSPRPATGDQLVVLVEVSDGLNSDWTAAGPFEVR